MDTLYKYNHAPSKHRIRHGLIVLFISFILISGIGVAVAWNVHTHNRLQIITSSGVTLVPQKVSVQAQVLVDLPVYTIRLPSDWKQVSAQASSNTWQSTLKSDEARSLTIYVDKIPNTTPVNRELPIVAHDNQLTFGELSNNCANFTPGGTLDVGKAEKLKPAPSLWQGVNFICNLTQVIENQVGTGSAAGINTVTVTGPKTGAHNYFFFYTDHNIQPDYSVLYDSIQSFRAK